MELEHLINNGIVGGAFGFIVGIIDDRTKGAEIDIRNYIEQKTNAPKESHKMIARKIHEDKLKAANYGGIIPTIQLFLINRPLYDSYILFADCGLAYFAGIKLGNRLSMKIRDVAKPVKKLMTEFEYTHNQLINDTDNLSATDQFFRIQRIRDIAIMTYERKKNIKLFEKMDSSIEDIAEHINLFKNVKEKLKDEKTIFALYENETAESVMLIPDQSNICILEKKDIYKENHASTMQLDTTETIPSEIIKWNGKIAQMIQIAKKYSEKNVFILNHESEDYNKQTLKQKIVIANTFLKSQNEYAIAQQQ